MNIEIPIPAFIQQFAAWFVTLLTPAEWSALVWLILGTFVFTHFAKIAWRLLPIRGGGSHGVIHLLACTIGTGIAFHVWPPGHAPWWVAGPVGAAGAIGIFKSFYPLLSTFFPKLAGAFNADRRRRDEPPPDGMQKRKSDKEDA